MASNSIIASRTPDAVYEEEFEINMLGHAENDGANFICPHCQAYAYHTWGRPSAIKISGARYMDFNAGVPPIVISSCGACKSRSIFAENRLVYPSQSDAPFADPDMPEHIKADFDEARMIYKQSPRGAAALLRLAIQKLCKELGSDAKDINKAIGELVEEGAIRPMVAKALDTVRVIGNESVHPGEMNIKDDPATVRALFGLVNLVVEQGIGEVKRLHAIFETLPQGKRDGIAQRDAPKATKAEG